MNKQYFIQLSDYNVWATNIFCNMLQQISDEQWTQKIVSSFDTIQETTLHIISAEKAWLQRFKKETVEWLQFSFKGSKDEHIKMWQQSSSDLKNYMNAFDENELNIILHYKRLNGEKKSTPFNIMFAHVFNHSTHHRGQLVTMLRQVGLASIQSSDIIGFYK